MPEDDVKCEFLTVSCTDTLLVYKNKYYQQVYSANSAYGITNKQMVDYLDHNLF